MAEFNDIPLGVKCEIILLEDDLSPQNIASRLSLKLERVEAYLDYINSGEFWKMKGEPKP